MAEPLGDLTRTHTCGALRATDVGREVVLLGWVHRIRDLGGVTFIDIRDRAGVSQVVVRENDALMTVAKRLRSEFVIGVIGSVQRRLTGLRPASYEPVCADERRSKCHAKSLPAPVDTPPPPHRPE